MIYTDCIDLKEMINVARKRNNTKSKLMNFTDEEFALLESLAHSFGLDTTNYIRLVCLGKLKLN